MSTSVPSTLCPTLASRAAELAPRYRKVRKAWAAWQKAAENARLAAVMGFSLSRHCDAPEWDPELTLSKDPIYQEAKTRLATAQDDPRDAHALHLAVKDHIQWLVKEMSKGLYKECRDTFGCDILAASDLESAAKQLEAKYHRLEAKLKSQIAMVERESIVLVNKGKGLSKAREAVIAKYDDQVAFITTKANDLTFADLAHADCTNTITALRNRWECKGKAPRLFFQSAKYTKLLKERKAIADEKTHHELRLQEYFDHSSQGASRSESSKIDKKSLRLAEQLIQGGKGYKQIQITDTYCQSRGNELWAIIPDLIRIGHDIDPVECVHWKPPILNNTPDKVKPYREAQNHAFAKALLSLCDPGLRTKLLSRREHGVSKVEFKADECDGLSLYWVLLQLYHPLDRTHRRTLEKELYAFPNKFASGNPITTLEAMQVKHQEAMDVQLRLKWDSVGIPLIDVLSTRDPLFAVELSAYRDMPDDPDDSAVVLDQLLSQVRIVVEILDTAKKDWEVRSAKAASKSESKMDAMAKKISELQKALKAGMPNPNPLPSNSDKPGYCQVVGCTQKVQGYTPSNNWKVCGTCLLKVRSTNKPVNLRNGNTWGTARSAVDILIARVDKGIDIEGCPARKALIAQRQRIAKRASSNPDALSKSAKKAKAKRKREEAAQAAEESEGSDDEGVAKSARTNNNHSPAAQLFDSLKRKVSFSKGSKLPSERKGPR